MGYSQILECRKLFPILQKISQELSKYIAVFKKAFFRVSLESDSNQSFPIITSDLFNEFYDILIITSKKLQDLHHNQE
jgi:hypothetical protein